MMQIIQFIAPFELKNIRENYILHEYEHLYKNLFMSNVYTRLDYVQSKQMSQSVNQSINPSIRKYLQ